MGKLQLIPFLAAACILLLLVTGSMAAPSKGVIYVDSFPKGAEIYLTNESVSPDNLTVEDTAGITPREFFVDPGTYRLFLKKYGYITWWNESFDVTPESYQVFNVTMTEMNPQYGALHIDSNPPGAKLVLQRFIPDITSVIYSDTPASLESLPPGTYNYTLTKEGYYPEEGTTTITAGDVTEIYVNMDPIPDSAIITFKSEPNTARVIIAGGNFSAMQSGLKTDIETYLESYEGTADEASAHIQSIVGAETVPPIKIVAGLVGTTPFSMELHEGKYVYKYFLDGYSMKEDIGTFDVTVGNDDTILETLIPDQEFVQVFFETNIDDEGGASVSVNGDVYGPTPCWVPLPSQEIVDVIFDQMPLYAKKTVRVDTTLFEGRPSKWGDIVQLELMTYYITTITDAHSSINPSGLPLDPFEVKAGNTTLFTLSGEQPAWVIDNFTVTRDGHAPLPYDDYRNQSSVTYPHTTTLENATLSLTSAKKKVFVNAKAGKGGTVNYPGITMYDYGSNTLGYNFTPDADYSVKQLYDNEVPVPWAPSYGIYNIQENHTLRCEFSPNYIWITPLTGPGGKILDGAEEAVPYKIPYAGTTRQHEAVADLGYKFVKFEEERESEVFQSEADHYYWGPISGLTANTTVTALFEPLNFTINSRVEDETKGMIVPAHDNYTASYGENLSFKVTGFTGFQFSDLTDNGISKGAVNPYNITVTEDHDIVAHFQSDVLTITAVAGEGGKIEPNGSVEVTFGEDQCFNITANPNYYISSVIVDEEDLGNQTSPYTYCFDNVTTDHAIEAEFLQYAYTITPTAGTGGTISPSTPQVVPIGDDITFTITPGSCYTILDVQVDGVSKGALSTYTFEDVNADHSIHADFKIKKYEILVNQSEGGVIEPAGTDGIVDVNCGSNQRFNITPDAGNAIYDVVVDGESVGTDKQYTFVNVTSDHSIGAVFIIPPEPDFEADRVRVPPKYPVTFKDFTRNNPTDWLWDFGDGEITTTREPVHLYAEVGNYTVTLSAYNAAAFDGVNTTKVNYIEVTNNPIAEFSVDKTGGILGSDVQISFSDTSLNTNGVAYGWVFGDNSPGSLAKNVSHKYTAPGVYQVTHQVEKPFIAKDYAYETITILQKPEADFIAHPVSGKSPLTVQFEDRSQGFPTSWLWDFGDTVKSYDQNPVHIYGASGNYTVSLSVFSDEGSSLKTQEGFITVL
ncbi:MAG: PKD domain-containing protein [Methanomicrobiales archaeon]|nr:PKD domain-containing protein [Methanomicrobiales archaeon]